MDSEHIVGQMEVNTKEIGKIINHMVSVSINLATVIHMKANGWMEWNMEMEYINGKIQAFMKVNIKMMKNRVMENTNQ